MVKQGKFSQTPLTPLRHIVKTQRNSTQLKATLKQLALESRVPIYI